jgi:hypothetical protein
MPLGYESLHFYEVDPYIGYFDPAFDGIYHHSGNGDSMPKKAYFENWYYDRSLRLFYGEINLFIGENNGEMSWYEYPGIYQFAFTEDLSELEWGKLSVY